MSTPADEVLREIDILLNIYRNPGLRDASLERLREKVRALSQLPKEPPPGLIDSMCLRYAHDFWFDADDTSPIASGWTEEEREGLRRTMRQLYEEVAGHGFYRP